MTGERRRLRATFWLLDAPESLAAQNRCNPDGNGIGPFADDGTREVRYVPTGGLSVEDTQPFALAPRLFAHQRHIEDLGALEGWR